MESSHILVLGIIIHQLITNYRISDLEKRVNKLEQNIKSFKSKSEENIEQNKFFDLSKLRN